MSIPLRHKIIFALAFLHLAMVALFASHLADSDFIKTPPGKALSTIGYYSGSNNIFSFFAPGLSDQPYVIYVLKYDNGREEIVDFNGRSPDFTNRINNIYGYLTLEEGREVFSASLAQAILRRYPGANKVRVTMLVQVIPTMEGYRNGERSKWRFWFHYDYQNRMAPSPH